MRRKRRQRIATWMVIVAAVALALGGHRVAADREAEAQRRSAEMSDLYESILSDLQSVGRMQPDGCLGRGYFEYGEDVSGNGEGCDAPN